MLYQDIVDAQLRALHAADNPDVLACPTCQGTYFEEVEFKQFRQNHMIIPGQHVPSIGQEYWILRCAACSAYLEPTTSFGIADQKARASYAKLVEALQSKKEVETKLV